VLAELENGNWVVIAGAAGGGDDGMIRVLDPLAQRPEFILLNEEQFPKAGADRWCW
jgi:subfamily B ATP-binding cassette protein HlyB/CyaB